MCLAFLVRLVWVAFYFLQRTVGLVLNVCIEHFLITLLRGLDILLPSNELKACVAVLDGYRQQYVAPLYPIFDTLQVCYHPALLSCANQQMYVR